MTVFRTGLGAARAIHDECGGDEKWYAGVTENWKRRLRQHKVNLECGAFAVVECENDKVAREAERILVGNGYGGGAGSGDEDAKFVYAYQITDDTCEDC